MYFRVEWTSRPWCRCIQTPRARHLAESAPVTAGAHGKKGMSQVFLGRVASKVAARHPAGGGRGRAAPGPGEMVGCNVLLTGSPGAATSGFYSSRLTNRTSQAAPFSTLPAASRMVSSPRRKGWLMTNAS